MKQTVYFSTFRNAFADYHREGQFSYQALEIIYDYLRETEDAMGEEIELDVIGICCAYAELTFQELAETYGDGATTLDSEESVRDFCDNKDILIIGFACGFNGDTVIIEAV